MLNRRTGTRNRFVTLFSYQRLERLDLYVSNAVKLSIDRQREGGLNSLYLKIVWKAVLESP